MSAMRSARVCACWQTLQWFLNALTVCWTWSRSRIVSQSHTMNCNGSFIFAHRYVWHHWLSIWAICSFVCVCVCVRTRDAVRVQVKRRLLTSTKLQLVFGPSNVAARESRIGWKRSWRQQTSAVNIRRRRWSAVDTNRTQINTAATTTQRTLHTNNSIDLLFVADSIGIDGSKTETHANRVWVREIRFLVLKLLWIWKREKKKCRISTKCDRKQ